ncbi:MAG: CCA tRNA nucleotidyltransferase [Candidatus Huberarchaeum crystalense]|uniref:CCA-adding enzyme n=1 Tax=Huberarchaeum crystalense TaxID=2014257 RepID=A0A2G9LIW1_HUBC1|nr:CCA tRNA nucleotidyltransferase [archaeon]OIP20298.1 MAG: CCA-adding enzyme [archaeon CG2_30_31_98]PIN66455.1 MAG: CCA tRNA nucleotidyltransferase [Candidatus Huberarchaeum crystalense]NCS98165.1 CCA tRNA nucleotidyltransferase [archaeon]PIV13725.1 MAG: CCA tRNA nucleotidyltransferase [Candidatus Huberarchaeum crystalense]
MNIKKIVEKVSPNTQEKKQVKEVKLKIERALCKIVKKYTLIDRYVFAGSFAKNTWIAGHNEFDVFLVFSKKANIIQLEKQGLDCGKKLAVALKGKQHLVYASHPYSLITLPNRFSLDLVPCYAVNNSEKIISAVDRSPLHVDFVKKAIHKNPQIVVEIRLLKQFLKRFDLYGADDVVQGFSGYLAELLIIYYKTFEKTIKNFAKWRGKEHICFGSNKQKKQIAQKKYFGSAPFVVIDPTDENRNVAANVSKEVFDKFVLYSNLYLTAPKNQKEAYFFKKIPYLKNLKTIIKQRKTSWVFLKIDLSKESLQINIVPKIRRLLKGIERTLNSFEFTCLNSWFFVEKKQAVLAFEFPSTTLSFFERKIGPQLYNHQHLLVFLNQHKDAMRFYTQDSRICADVARSHSDALLLITLLLQQKKVGMNASLAEAINTRRFGFVKFSQLTKHCRESLADVLSDKFEDLYLFPD